MTDVNHVIEAIDHALEDYGTSGDAMRWAPEPHPEAGAGIGCWRPVGTLDEGISFTVDLDEEIVPSYMDTLRAAVRALTAAYGVTSHPYYPWEAGRPADHTEHIHIDVYSGDVYSVGDDAP